MTGPEHFREAERLTALAASIWSADEDSRDGTMPDAGLSTTGLFAEVRAEQILREIREARRQNARLEAAAVLASAQVHATLAQAAATAELDYYGSSEDGGTGRTLRQTYAWREVMDGGESL